MRKKNILLTGLLWVLGAGWALAQTHGGWIKNTNTYELDDMVIVTAYKKGVPTGKFHVTGDRKIRIMKAIGAIQDAVKPEYVPDSQAITTIPLYSYMYSLARLDSADTYEVAPFLRTSTNAYGPVMEWENGYKVDIGGIVISADRKDSTVVYGTVNRVEDDSHRDVFYRPDSIFSYPFQYIKGEPVQGAHIAEKVQALRTELQEIESYRKGFHYYGTPWMLQQKGDVKVNFYEKGKCIRQGRIPADDIMQTIREYLLTLQIDYTGRGYFKSYSLKNGTTEGLEFLSAVEQLLNVYPSVKDEACIEIIFPSYVGIADVKGLLIQLADRDARVYGLTSDGMAGDPFLFYNDARDTRKFYRWLKKHVNWHWVYNKKNKNQ